MPSALIPTALHPLTPSFPGPAPPSDPPRAHHPATPPFLLSLLATSVYLSIPSLASQALTYILNTVGPYTVIPYLQFATGSALDFPTKHGTDGAVGLEHIAEVLEPPSLSDSHDVLADKLHDLDVQKEDPAESDSESDPTDRSRCSPSFNYGAVSDKIGEAAACWLARWGPDMLLHEERASHVRDMPLAPIPSHPTSSRRRADTLPSRPSTDESSPPAPHRVPLIWARGGLTSTWIRELISSDALFVKGERERYDLARTVVELRRRQGIDDDEEKDWEIMFRHGIYYANMVLSFFMCPAHFLTRSVSSSMILLQSHRTFLQQLVDRLYLYPFFKMPTGHNPCFAVIQPRDPEATPRLHLARRQDATKNWASALPLPKSIHDFQTRLSSSPL